jgi:hypothetical protein
MICIALSYRLETARPVFAVWNEGLGDELTALVAQRKADDAEHAASAFDSASDSTIPSEESCFFD